MRSPSCYLKMYMTMIKLFIKMLHPSVSLLQSLRPNIDDVDFEELNAKAMVPQDVKEGHFAVFAVNCEKPKRFIVELCYLNNPAFFRLLEKAEEEYGFQQMGALAVPCRPEELHKILQENNI